MANNHPAPTPPRRSFQPRPVDWQGKSFHSTPSVSITSDGSAPPPVKASKRLSTPYPTNRQTPFTLSEHMLNHHPSGALEAGSDTMSRFSHERVHGQTGGGRFSLDGVKASISLTNISAAHGSVNGGRFSFGDVGGGPSSNGPNMGGISPGSVRRRLASRSLLELSANTESINDVLLRPRKQPDPRSLVKSRHSLIPLDSCVLYVDPELEEEDECMQANIPRSSR